MAAQQLHEAGLLHALTYTSPNEGEVIAMANALHRVEGAAAQDGRARSRGDELSEGGAEAHASEEGDRRGGEDAGVHEAAAALVHAGCANVFVTRGARGVLWATRSAGHVCHTTTDPLPSSWP